MKIDSNKVSVAANIETVAAFLINAENFLHLLPQDQISDWKADKSECSFKVQGGVIISLIQNGHDDNVKIFMKSGQKSPFPFTLTVNLAAIENGTEGYISFDGEVNVFLKMMVEKPLTALFNMMSSKLKEYFDK